jgi:hypothetical protein
VALMPEPMSAERLAEIRAVLTGAGPSIPMGPNALFALQKDRDENRRAGVALLAEVDRLRTQMAIVEVFLAERTEFVTTLRQCIDDNADYHRWQGHAEARRVLSERLGLPVGWPPEDAAKAALRAQQGGGVS